MSYIFFDWHIVDKEKHNFNELARRLTKIKAGIVAKHLLISFICIISARHLHKGKHIMHQEVTHFLCRCTDFLKYKKINEKEGKLASKLVDG